uniref:Uncharacterized protein n=1 Tax=Rhizophora mucronata TaxID=61149 RepID=A0A2P2NZR4_RHIMU
MVERSPHDYQSYPYPICIIIGVGGPSLSRTRRQTLQFIIARMNQGPTWRSY